MPIIQPEQFWELFAELANYIPNNGTLRDAYPKPGPLSIALFGDKANPGFFKSLEKRISEFAKEPVNYTRNGSSCCFKKNNNNSLISIHYTNSTNRNNIIQKMKDSSQQTNPTEELKVVIAYFGQQIKSSDIESKAIELFGGEYYQNLLLIVGPSETKQNNESLPNYYNRIRENSIRPDYEAYQLVQPNGSNKYEFKKLPDKEIIREFSKINTASPVVASPINNVKSPPITISQNSMKKPLNQILFGPPGTGKTYNTVNKAIEIINPNFDLKQKREKIKQEFDQLMKEGQIVFTTFHQSMSYEDFIEGIKPIEPSNDGGAVVYRIRDGIFKELCDMIQFSKATDFLSKKIPFPLPMKTGNAEVVEINHKVIVINRITDNKSFRFLISEVEKDYSELLVKPENLLGLRQSKAEYGYLLEFLLNLNNRLDYVLIIDEINRGNVSQVFGELITLIEEDKRIGRDEALEVTLPYSKEKFSVPPNLYIIGTMNTADRSVEALDTALRRRFSFEEMPPNYNLKELNYECAGNKGYVILERINKRIEKLLDKDHLIGHSYFMKKEGENANEKLLASFYKNIIPLLQEYFFGDYGKVGLVLGDGFVKIKEPSNTDNLFAKFTSESIPDYSDKPVYEIIDYRIENIDYKLKDANSNDIQMTFENAVKILMNQNIG